MTENNKTKTITYCALLTAIMCVVGPACIPAGVVPVTFGLAVVMLAAVVADLKTAAISTVLYVVLGALGLPVFSGGQGSLAVLLGPTGGYIWGYIPAVVLCAVLSNKNSPTKTYAACIIGTAICYICGAVQYMIISRCGFYDALRLCVIPFIIPDALKMLFVSAVGIKIKRRLSLVL